MKIRDFFRLVRIPTVFSSMSNAYAGFWIGGTGAGLRVLIPGLIAAALYVMAGMALNDVADLKVDREERPDRPLPSGAISLPVAWLLSLGMMALALVLQWIANPVAACVGVLLIAAIFLYNFALKGTLLGPVSMGLCRLLNLLCGVALCADGLTDLFFLPHETLWALGALGFYIACVTYLARDEVGGNSLFRVRVFFASLTAWVAAWVALGALQGPWRFAPLVAVLALQGKLLYPALSKLWKEPLSPASTGRSIGALLRALPCTDAVAMLANGVALPWALLGLAWMLPGPFLAKRFYST